MFLDPYNQPRWFQIVGQIALVPTTLWLIWMAFRLETGHQFTPIFEAKKLLRIIFLIGLVPMGSEIFRLWARALGFMESASEAGRGVFLVLVGSVLIYFGQLYLLALRNGRIPRITSLPRLIPLILFLGLMGAFMISLNSKLENFWRHTVRAPFIPVQN